VEKFKEYILSLAKVEELVEVQERPPATIAGFSKDFEFYIPVEFGAKVEELIQSYKRKLQEVEKTLDNLSARLKSPNFLEKAPPEEVEKTKQSVEELTQEQERLSKLIKLLEEVMVEL